MIFLTHIILNGEIKIIKKLIKYLYEKKFKTKYNLIKLIHKFSELNIINSNSIPILETVINAEQIKAKDIMIPRISIDFININDNIDKIINKIIVTRHSRFPVIDGDLGNVIGILHTKDLFSIIKMQESFNLIDLVRDAYFVSNLKQIDELMFEMRARQNHMAIVVDEFTNIVGLITLELIVEQFLGEIEDEHDSVDGERNILYIEENQYRVKGHCKLNNLNNILNIKWNDDIVETVNGYLIKKFKRIPHIGEKIILDGVELEIINSDSRKINLLKITKKNKNK